MSEASGLMNTDGISENSVVHLLVTHQTKGKKEHPNLLLTPLYKPESKEGSEPCSPNVSHHCSTETSALPQH